MNLRWIRTFICCGALMMALCNVGQAGDSWFGSSKAPAANGVTTNSKKSWWPSWPTSTKSKPKPTASKSTSMWSSVTKGTKNTWNKTTSFLNPFDNKPRKRPPTQVLRPAIPPPTRAVGSEPRRPRPRKWPRCMISWAKRNPSGKALTALEEFPEMWHTIAP